ncbi:MAG: hypothetical protein GY947_16385 [Rhodobacteraceae bacterium]|nr:hypothetical protein [Paracoccaceae bacterium]
MLTDPLFLMLAALIGAVLQVGVGIGFSIVAGPPMMLALGTETAIPLLLLLNTIVSAVASDWRLLRPESKIIRTSLIGTVVGIGLGALTFTLLSEAFLLGITATLLLIGVVATLLSVQVSTRWFLTISGFSGLATIWAATPGPLMVLGLLSVGRNAAEVRKLVQPIALVAYGLALSLHLLSGRPVFSMAPELVGFVAATIAGSLVGKAVGRYLPVPLIVNTVRIISILAALALFRRALSHL